MQKAKAARFCIMGNYYSIMARNTANPVPQLTYIPPCPARGSGVHFIVCAVGELTRDIKVVRETPLQDITSSPQNPIIGLSFYRTFWTKTVDQVLNNILSNF
jgi:hypothetical protein